MRLLPSLLVSTALAVSFCLSACGGDDDKQAGAGGAGGTGGGGAGGSSSGGSSTVSTSSATSSTGGSSNTGTDGTSTGASGGTGGTTSSGGSAGSAGAASSTEGGESGGGGEAGSAGAAGASAQALTCSVGCSSDDDCGTEFAEPRTCDQELGRCVQCRLNADCLPVANQWVFTCSDQEPCSFAGEVCIVVGGNGYCAATPSEGVCLFGGVPTEMPEFGSDGMVEVCATDSGRCENHVCVTGCTPESCLDSGWGNTCDSDTRKCTCDTDLECLNGPGHCNTTTHLCDRCDGTGEACLGNPNGQECVAGQCGCSSANACSTTVFPLGTPVCE